ncbi:uncharacterized protein BO88DRAFT_190690 [Aspergillus vadensis CBS 113365]|uniref:Uncharacterized protein n=1 Tax=Aspergillus vadensis (strain CBS 113365 / IMI 142717 / IBT 24658) TaxID=1448311 RepID=A0A319AWL3_ASPVC|nr:hypothetical protein BO88DRAFT_190690 [Aspergillus vadensis CBS 113365]PYH63994.1 hypothetical protein BO88DRAFT_190690 [Aspergillus vadensis CBS 113365]
MVDYVYSVIPLSSFPISRHLLTILSLFLASLPHLPHFPHLPLVSIFPFPFSLLRPASFAQPWSAGHPAPPLGLPSTAIRHLRRRSSHSERRIFASSLVNPSLAWSRVTVQPCLCEHVRLSANTISAGAMLSAFMPRYPYHITSVKRGQSMGTVALTLKVSNILAESSSKVWSRANQPLP